MPLTLPRLDRLATLFLVAPFQRCVTPPPLAVPVLMYHSISNQPEPGVAPYYQTCTSPARFRQQIRWLRDQGYRSLPLEDLPRLLSTGAPPEHPWTVITFDDGLQDFHTEAAPVLQEHGFTATMFLPTAFIGNQRGSFKQRPCLTWREIDELRRAGLRFGSHTVTHPRLHGLPWPQIEEELRASKDTLEQHLGEPVLTFAYPYAYPSADPGFMRRFEDRLQAAGYETNVTTQVGRAQPGQNLRRLPRLPVNSCDDPPLFSCKLRGAYDWLERPQRMIKRCKSWLRPSHGRAPRGDQ